MNAAFTRRVARVMVLAAEHRAALAAEREYFAACERATRAAEMPPRGADDATLDAYSRACAAAREAAGLSNETLRDLRTKRLACEEVLVAAVRRTFPAVMRGLSHTQVVEAAARAIAAALAAQSTPSRARAGSP